MLLEICMSRRQLEVGDSFWGSHQDGNTIYGPAFVIVATAIREEFVAQFGPEEMTDETRKFLDANPGLYFYRRQFTSIPELVIAWCS